MSHSQGSEVFTVWTSSGKEVSALVEVDIFIDNNYGADADGNRGQRAVFIEGPTVVTQLIVDNGETLDAKELKEARILLEIEAKRHDWSVEIY